MRVWWYTVPSYPRNRQSNFLLIKQIAKLTKLHRKTSWKQGQLLWITEKWAWCKYSNLKKWSLWICFGSNNTLILNENGSLNVKYEEITEIMLDMIAKYSMYKSCWKTDQYRLSKILIKLPKLGWFRKMCLTWSILKILRSVFLQESSL